MFTLNDLKSKNPGLAGFLLNERGLPVQGFLTTENGIILTDRPNYSMIDEIVSLCEEDPTMQIILINEFGVTELHKLWNDLENDSLDSPDYSEPLELLEPGALIYFFVKKWNNGEGKAFIGFKDYSSTWAIGHIELTDELEIFDRIALSETEGFFEGEIINLNSGLNSNENPETDFKI